jgi:hypothetical protein
MTEALHPVGEVLGCFWNIERIGNVGRIHYGSCGLGSVPRGCCGTGGRGPVQHALNADILVNSRPIDSLTVSKNFKFRRCSWVASNKRHDQLEHPR